MFARFFLTVLGTAYLAVHANPLPSPEGRPVLDANFERDLEDLSGYLSRRDNVTTIIPPTDPSLQTSPISVSGTITLSQLNEWIKEGSTGFGGSSPRSLSTATELLKGASSEPPKAENEKRQNVPITAEPSRIFGNQALGSVEKITTNGPFKMIECWSGDNTLSGMRLTDTNDAVTNIGTIETITDKYVIFVFSEGEVITSLQMLASSSGGYERFTGFNFSTNLYNNLQVGFKTDPTDAVAVERQAGGGFIYSITAMISDSQILNLGIDMVAPVKSVQYDQINFPQLSSEGFNLTGGRLITAGRLLVDNRNTSVSQSAVLRIDLVETYARTITSRWTTTTRVEQAFAVTVTAGLPELNGGVTSTTTNVKQGEYGEEKNIATTTSIDQGNWGTIACPAGKVCRCTATLMRWDSFSFDFTATMKLTTTTGAVWNWENKGTYKGTDFADWHVTLGEYTVVD